MAATVVAETSASSGWLIRSPYTCNGREIDGKCCKIECLMPPRKPVESTLERLTHESCDKSAAMAVDTNPKRQRGFRRIPSLTLRVGMGCVQLEGKPVYDLAEQ